MWEVKFSAEGEEGRTKQIAKLQHNGSLPETLSVIGKVLAKQSKTAQTAVVAVRMTQITASTKETKFKL